MTRFKFSTRDSHFLAIWPATVVLFALSPFLATGSTSPISLVVVLSYSSILTIAAIGQTLVIQQGGLDLTVPGVISVAAILVSKYPAGQNSEFATWATIAVGAGVLSGLINGIAITQFSITPFVSSLAVNAMLYGAADFMTKGISTETVPPVLGDFASGRIGYFPYLAIVAIIAVAIVETLVRGTRIGRQFVAIGASARAARAAGMRVVLFKLATYIAAGAIYAMAGILLAGYLNLPGLLVGATYLLPTVAAIVLGGTSLLGGAGSVAATAGGALFLTQLQQVTVGMGAPPSFQYIVEAVIIAIGMALRLVPWRAPFSRSRMMPM